MKGDVTYTKRNSRQATMYYKYKKDFSVSSFDDHYYSLVRSKDVVEKAVIDISRYVYYEERKKFHPAISNWSGESCYVRISRNMCEKFLASCS
jgi:hypothetical protein